MKTEQEQIKELKKYLKWTLNYIDEISILNESGTPKHNCNFVLNPDMGYCEFDENYWQARFLLKEFPNS